jgi:hypothetical protein
VQTDDGGYRAQVIDFGYSTISKNSDQVSIPYSENWTAPEWHLYRSFQYQHALNMDAYSFGLTCLWLLFFVDKDHIPEHILGGLPDSVDSLLKDGAVENPDIGRFLNRALRKDPRDRDISLLEISQILKSKP